KGAVPVLELADKLELEVRTPANKSELSALFADKPFSSELGIVIDYGIIINRDVIDYFSYGIINSHFSLLPEWRGADPITFAILSGQTRTGVSLMLINEKMDEGLLLAQAPYDLANDLTTPVLTSDLIQISYQALCEILPGYLDGNIQPAPQEEVSIANDTTPTYSRKLTKDDGILDFTKPAVVLEREIRAFIEWPKSRTTIAGKDVIITKAHASTTSSDHTIGRPYSENRELIIPTSEGNFVVDALQPAGKKEMTAEAFLAGHKHLL
ncbi:MAG: methionyl-tRNA formyltransferase, partial [Candidatus Saccharimonadales bacterium]